MAQAPDRGHGPAARSTTSSTSRTTSSSPRPSPSTPSISAEIGGGRIVVRKAKRGETLVDLDGRTLELAPGHARHRRRVPARGPGRRHRRPGLGHHGVDPRRLHRERQLRPGRDPQDGQEAGPLDRRLLPLRARGRYRLRAPGGPHGRVPARRRWAARPRRGLIDRLSQAPRSPRRSCSASAGSPSSSASRSPRASSSRSSGGLGFRVEEPPEGRLAGRGPDVPRGHLARGGPRRGGRPLLRLRPDPLGGHARRRPSRRPSTGSGSGSPGSARPCSARASTRSSTGASPTRKRRPPSASGRTPVAIQNPISIRASVLRTTLLPGLLENAAWNLNRGLEGVHIFEIGNVYYWGDDEKHREEPSPRAAVDRAPARRRLRQRRPRRRISSSSRAPSRRSSRRSASTRSASRNGTIPRSSPAGPWPSSTRARTVGRLGRPAPGLRRRLRRSSGPVYAAEIDLVGAVREDAPAVPVRAGPEVPRGRPRPVVPRGPRPSPTGDRPGPGQARPAPARGVRARRPVRGPARSRRTRSA